jgi:hypothetical protein
LLVAAAFLPLVSRIDDPMLTVLLQQEGASFRGRSRDARLGTIAEVKTQRQGKQIKWEKRGILGATNDSQQALLTGRRT